MTVSAPPWFTSGSSGLCNENSLYDKANISHSVCDREMEKFIIRDSCEYLAHAFSDLILDVTLLHISFSVSRECHKYCLHICSHYFESFS